MNVGTWLDPPTRRACRAGPSLCLPLCLPLCLFVSLSPCLSVSQRSYASRCEVVYAHSCGECGAYTGDGECDEDGVTCGAGTDTADCCRGGRVKLWEAGCAVEGFSLSVSLSLCLSVSLSLSLPLCLSLSF